ncbi:L,D-transpeptidase family protein [Bounagaea algeriensis]
MRSAAASARSAPRGRLLAACGALLLGLTACGTDAEPRTEPPQPRPVQNAYGVDLAQYPESTTYTDISRAPHDPAPQERTSGVVLRVEKDLPVYDSPGGQVIARLPAKQMESQTWVPVIAEQDDWARVMLPSRPNGSTGWVPVSSSEHVSKAHSPYEVEVDVDDRTLLVRENGEQIASWNVSVGAAESPTPRGRTFIMAAIDDQVIDYSPIVLPLGAHSDTYSTYGGGPGTVALHGWPDSRVFGQASSDGCVRVPDDALQLLRNLPLGTTVMLR